MKKTLLLFLVSGLAIITASAQDFGYGAATKEELSMQHYDKDTSAHAVVLNEYGSAKIDQMNDNLIKIIYEHHVKIKIFDSKGFTLGNVLIGLGNNDNDAESLEAVRGVTAWLDDDGSVKTTAFDPAKVYKEKVSKTFTEAKFAMPGIKNGCVIEYDYITSSPFLGHFPGWNFQWNIPKIHSLYDVRQPGFWTYNVSLRGGLKFSKNISEVIPDCFSARGASSGCVHMVFGMDDIPAFISESDMTSPANFISSVNFQLEAYKNLTTGAVTHYAQEWSDVDRDFDRSETFGQQLRKKGLFKDIVAPLLSAKTDTLEKAKAVFEYIQKNLKWNNLYGTGTSDGMRKVIENHSGNCAEINLALVAALTEAGVNAEPVILSTREHGYVSKLYPVTDGFNYVIAKVDAGGKSYLLDATDPLLPFGILPLRCLNDQGRVMARDKPSYWINLNTGQKKIRTFNMDLTLTPDGKLKGTLIQLSTGYDAYEKRKEIKQFNSTDEYVQSLDEKSSKFRFLSANFTNLDSLDEPLTETYEIELNENKNMDDEHLSINQFQLDHITRNPYRLAERNFPVDKGMALSEQFSFTLHLPANYVVDAPPKEINLALPDNGGKFQTFYQAGAGSFTYSHILQFNKAIYSPGEYAALKEFFNRIILFQKDQVRLNKKS
jgi:hypothetical protein